MHENNISTAETKKQRGQDSSISPMRTVRACSSDIESAALKLGILLKTIIEKIDRISDIPEEAREAVEAIDCFATVGLQFTGSILAANEAALTALSAEGGA